MLANTLGLLPAAGRASRLPGLSGSKEMVPVPLGPGGPVRPVVESLLGGFRESGIRRVIGILRSGKWDLARHLASATDPETTLAWVVVEESGSVVESLARGLPLVGDRVVALGFPDVILEPRNGFSPLQAPLAAGADVVLGLYLNDRPDRSDIVESTANGTVSRIRVKDPEAPAGWGWMTALWRPAFTEFLLSHWQTLAADRAGDERGELYPGDLFNLAIAGGLRVGSVRFEGGSCLDIGTPEDLARARQPR